MSDAVIRVENVWKQYRLGVISHNTLNKDLQSWWARVRGKEDPNRMLAQPNALLSPSGEDRFWALQDVAFDVQQGEVLGIIGRNGAGKSTLLKILSKITAPTKGQVSITGRVASLLEVGTGFHPELTGRENVFLNGAILGMSKEEIRRKFDEIVAFADIEQFIDTPVKRYSSGMYVRLAFAVAAHLEPEILIIDEVLAVGDVQFQKKSLGKIGAIGREGRTVLFVSHNMQAIRQFCKKSVLLDRGNLVMYDESDTVLKRYLDEVMSNGLDELAGIASSIQNLPDDDVFELKDIVLYQQAKVKNTVKSGEDLIIIVSYEIFKPVHGFHIFFQIHDSDGTILIETINNGDSDELPLSIPGEYESRLVIPADFFSPLRYEFHFWAGIANVRGCMPHPVKFSVDVEHTGRVNRAYPGYISRAKLSPLFSWKTEVLTTNHTAISGHNNDAMSYL